MTAVRVVAAVVWKGDSLLLGLRPPDKRHGGLWEFPGGKLDPGESAEDAARRELAEELDLEVTEVGPRLLSIGDGASPFVIEFYPVSVEGEPEALEHARIGWFALADLPTMPLAPADRSFVEWLSRGGRVDPDAGPQPSPWGSRSSDPRP